MLNYFISPTVRDTIIFFLLLFYIYHLARFQKEMYLKSQKNGSKIKLNKLLFWFILVGKVIIRIENFQLSKKMPYPRIEPTYLTCRASLVAIILIFKNNSLSTPSLFIWSSFTRSLFCWAVYTSDQMDQ